MAAVKLAKKTDLDALTLALPYHPKDYGADGEGSADDTAALLATIAAAKANHFELPAGLAYGAGAHYQRGTVDLGSGYYKITSKLTVDLKFISFVGDGAIIDASAITTGAALELTGTGDELQGTTPFGQASQQVGGFELVGPGATQVNSIGILYHGPTVPSGPSRTTQFNVAVHKFGAAFKLGDNAYALNIRGCELYDCLYGVWVASPAPTNSGERITFTDCTIYECQWLVHMDHAGCELRFVSCSLDYPVTKVAGFGTPGDADNPRQSIIHAMNGTVTCIGCHIEHNGDEDYWFNLLYNTAAIRLIACDIWITADKSVWALGQGGFYGVSAWAMISMRDCYFYNESDYNLPVLIEGVARVEASGLTGWSNAPQPPVSRYASLIDGTFNTLETLDFWTTPATANPVVRDTSVQFEGAASLKLSVPPATFTDTRSYVQVPYPPGKQLRMSWRQRLENVGGLGGTLELKVFYLDRAGHLLNTETRSYNVDNPAGWTLEFLDAQDSVSGYARDKAQIEFQANAWSSTMAAWIDDLIIEVV